MFNPTAFKKWLETSTPRQKLTAAVLLFSLLATGALFAMRETSQSASNPLDSTPLYFFGVFIKLAGVLLLIVAVAVIARRWTNPGSQGERVQMLRLVETVRLSPKQALHLVEVGDKQILIGATDQSISLITPIEISTKALPAENSQAQPAKDFSSVLQAFNLHPSVESGTEKE